MTVIKRRGQRSLHVTHGVANRDPIAVGRAIWMGGYDPIIEVMPVQELPPVQELLPPPEQHNDHVMTYWQWRLDRLEGKHYG